MMKREYKSINWKYTVLANFGALGYPMFCLGFLILCFRELNKLSFTEPLLRLPFIIIIAFATIKLVEGYNPKLLVLKKSYKTKGD